MIIIDQHIGIVFTIEWWRLDDYKSQVFLNDGRIATTVDLHSLLEAYQATQSIIEYQGIDETILLNEQT